MGIQYSDMPAWEFASLESQPGIHTVSAVRDGGISASSTGSDPDELLRELLAWARRTETALPAQQTTSNAEAAPLPALVA